MNFFIDNWYLIVLVIASGAMLALPGLQGAAGGVSPERAVQLINREKAVVIDVCETEEYAQGHVVGSKNLPLAQLEERLPATVKNKALPVLLVCATGPRAQRAVATARKLGYENAQAVAGGLKAWRTANLPLEKS